MAGMERELARMREMREHKVQYGKMRKNAVQEGFEAKNDDEAERNQEKLLSDAKIYRFESNLRPLKLAYVDSDRIYGPK